MRPHPGDRRHGGGPLELYNLKEDTGETSNVAAQNPKALARIEEYLKTARTEPRPQLQPQGEW